MRKKLSMKTPLSLRLLGSLACLGLTLSNATAELEVSASVQIHTKTEFEAPLCAHGTWVEVGPHGRCWRPAGLSLEWRPYCAGEWVWTDCGWYWASDEPWAWACYHYGWWVYDSGYGWVWVPNVEWAPAWVSRRVGGGYIGWAPVSPPGWIFATKPHAEFFVFVGTGHFNEPIRSSTLIFKNTVVFNKTAEIGGIKHESRDFHGSSSQRVLVNHGPSVELVEKASGRAIKSIPIREATRRTRGSLEARVASQTEVGGKRSKDRPDYSSDQQGPPQDRASEHSIDQSSRAANGSAPGPSGNNRDHASGGAHGRGRK